MIFSQKYLLRMLVPAVVAGAVTGCSVGPNFHRPDPPVTSVYSLARQPAETVTAGGPGGSAQHFNAGMDIPASWWSLFRCEPLDRMVRLALAGSPTLAQARARLIQAREDLNARTGATRYPAVDAGLSAVRQQVDTAAFGVANVPSLGPFTLYNASVSVSYALDLFGGNRRALEGLGAKVDYQQFELEAARQTLAANVVIAAIMQASLHAQIAAVQDLLSAQKRQLDITQQRYQAGGVSLLDVQNQSLLLDQTRVLLPPMEKQLMQVNHQLSTYLGQEPAQVEIASISLNTLHLPEELPLSLPSSLARQRPDIRAAEALLHQASANIGVATANLYPQIKLSGSLGTERTSLADILSGYNVWSLGANLAQPLFRGGELMAQKRSAVAAYDEALAGYKETVLQGLQEVADTLYALDADARTLKTRADATGHAQAGYAMAEQQYQLGGISQLVLLDAQRQLLQSDIEKVRAQADRYTDTAALLHALGGGWWQAEKGKSAGGN